MLIEQSLLIDYAEKYDSNQSLHEGIVKKAEQNEIKTAFLCHSHEDVRLVKGLSAMFRLKGIELYIDWADNSLPSTPNRLTASKIQEKIDDSEYFFFLSTENSMKSRWCPWEIGYADKSNSKILIIPTRDGRNNYGNEYLGLYSSLDGKVDVNILYSTYKLGIKNSNGWFPIWDQLSNSALEKL